MPKLMTRRKRRGAHTMKKTRLGLLPWVTVICLIGGAGIFGYPQMASWFTQYNQSKAIDVYENQLKDVKPNVSTQLREARVYNEELSTGVLLPAQGNKPVGAGRKHGGSAKPYSAQLTTPSGLMSRLKIPSIKLDLPIYHGTDEDTLLKGLGHLEGTSLPVGGRSTRSVITGHRGLASATMFTHLDQVKKGDTFTLETFDEVLSYQVRDIKVVAPEDTETLHQESDEDLVTLITCTPLGVNTHRILVTGQRITPALQQAINDAGKTPDVPGFPWWLLEFIGAILLSALYLLWMKKSPTKTRRTGPNTRVATRANEQPKPPGTGAPSPEPAPRKRSHRTSRPAEHEPAG